MLRFLVVSGNLFLYLCGFTFNQHFSRSSGLFYSFLKCVISLPVIGFVSTVQSVEQGFGCLVLMLLLSIYGHVSNSNDSPLCFAVTFLLFSAFSL